VIVVHTLDRLGRTVRDTLNLIHELSERKVGVRNLADPIKVDSSNPEDPVAQLAVVLLAIFRAGAFWRLLPTDAQQRSKSPSPDRQGSPSLVIETGLCRSKPSPRSGPRELASAPGGSDAGRASSSGSSRGTVRNRQRYGGARRARTTSAWTATHAAGRVDLGHATECQRVDRR
jgi:Resolvase, N terminal domain